MCSYMPLQTAIVDDERPARELLRRYVLAHPKLKFAGEAGNGVNAIALVERTQPDLLLLDIEMPGDDGFAVLVRLREDGRVPPCVIFVTAFDHYAVRAFEVNAIDYLLKPVVSARFDEAIARCVRRRSEGAVTDATPLLSDVLRLPPTRLLAREHGRIIPLPLEEIRWIEAEGDYVRIHTGSRTHLIEWTLSDMEGVLFPLGFRRVHRGAIVNLKAVRELVSEGSGRYRIVLVNGEAVTASRSYSGQFRDIVM